MKTVISDPPAPSPLMVAGERITDGDVHVVRAPWDGSPVGAIPLLDADAARVAVEAAARAMADPLPAHERARILDRAVESIRTRHEELSVLLAAEAGKPVTQARVEVDRTIQTLTFSAVEARTLAGRGVPMDAHPAGEGKLGFTIRVPIGVVAAITPFNFPLNLAAHKVGPAIAAGCAVVLKPAKKAPLAALRLVDILHESGLPPEWLSTVAGPSAEIADVFVTDDRVGLITFTGSGKVGWGLAARAPRKRVTLELGNSTPVIVLADADLDAAVAAVAGSANGFAGQSCISVQRVLVEESVHDEFAARLVVAAGALPTGDPLEEDTVVGPMIDEPNRERILGWIAEAERAGARPILDGRGGRHLKPTVLDDIPIGATAWHTEAFAPMVGLRTFTTFDEAIASANDTPYGLQAGVFTSDLGVAMEAARRLNFGGVTINETPSFRVDQMPYGGVKGSGNTREGPHFAVREMTEERMIVISA